MIKKILLFVALFTYSILISVFQLTDFCQPSLAQAGTIDLPRTGKVDTFHIGSDGDIQAGVAWPTPRFIDNDDGTLTDNLTGLMWLKDADCFDHNELDNALFELIDFFNKNPGIIGCEDYHASYTDWALPNINELGSILLNLGEEEIDEWLESEGFLNVTFGSYLTSTTTQSQGFAIRSLNNTIESMFHRADSEFEKVFGTVWLVRPGPFINSAPAKVWQTGQSKSFIIGDEGISKRGVEWPNPRFTNNGDGTVMDNLTGLVWLRDATCFKDLDWDEMLDAISRFNQDPSEFECAAYNAQHSDWRLSNYKELFSLMDYSQILPENIKALPNGHPFALPNSGSYFSSTTKGIGTGVYIFDLFGKVWIESGSRGSEHMFGWPVRLGVVNIATTSVPKPTPAPVQGKPPIANFIAKPTLGTSPLDVQFTDKSTELPTGWFWQFGDGSISTLQNPLHVYILSGLFSVKLEVSNTLGKDTEEKTDFIDVRETSELKAEFTADPVFGFVPLEAKFKDLSIGDPTSWVWQFGDGGQSAEQNPKHEYLRQGVFNVDLTVTRSGESSTEKKINFINVTENRPVAEFMASVTAGQAPLKVEFTDLSQPVDNITSWLWNLSDGSSETGQNPEHQYNIEGFYTVSLTVSNQSGSDSEVKTNMIAVMGQNAPVADFITNKTVGLAPEAIDFFDQSEPVGNISNWIWDFGDGTRSQEQHPTHTYEKEGIFTITLTVSNSFGADSEVKTNLIPIIGTNDDVLAGFSASNNVGVAPFSARFNNNSGGKITGFTWQFGDGATSSEKDPAHLYAKTGEFDVSLSVKGALSSDTEKKPKFIKIISNQDVAAWFTASPLTGNGPLVVQFVDRSVGNTDKWLWDFGDGNTSTDQNPKHVYTEKGRYTVSVAVSGKSGTSDVKKRENFIDILESGAAATPTPVSTPAPTPTPEAKGCLASALLKGEPDEKSGLKTLRGFRTGALSRTTAGLRLSILYYKHSAEVSRIVESDSKLKARSVTALKELTEIIRGSIFSSSVEDFADNLMPVWLEDEINSLLDDIAKRGSDELKEAVVMAREMVYGR